MAPFGGITATGTARFGILGPLQVTNAGRQLKSAGPLPRALLAALLVRAGQPVGLSAVVDALWGERPPTSAVANVHTYVSRLRRALATVGLRDVLVTDGGGYRLLVEPGQLDSHAFQTAAERARAAYAAGDALAAVSLWEQAWTAWRGDPLEDVPRAGWLDAEAVRLEQLAAAAREDFADARLAAGQYGILIPELAALVRKQPLREGLWQRLMVAQQRAGRRAEALETYRAVRDVLVDALGVEPCDTLQELHQVILRDEAPEADEVVRPMQLPPDVDHFTGRAAELTELLDLLTRPGRSPVAAITGKAGVGKTALAVRVAHEVAGHFGGGQLYVRLGGPRSPREPATVLASLLAAFGVHPHAVPDDVEGRAAMYRSQLASRRVLVVLDDVASMAQIRPLLPGSAGSAVLVTSRAQLVDAHSVRLDVLGADDSVRLLSSIAGPARVTAEPAAAAAVARYCGNLPLALRIAGSRLARRGLWTVGRLAERLADEETRLNELRIDDLEARASLAWSYEALDEVAQRAFRLLSLLDVPDFPAWVVAALLEVDSPTADDVVDGLADVHLVEVCGIDATGQARYRFHDLLRVFARERAYAVDTPACREAALRRAFDAWLSLAVRAEADLPCRFLKVRLAPGNGTPFDPGIADRVLTDPLAWLDAERDGLVAVVEQALALGMTTQACDIACALTTLFDLRSHYDLWRHTHELALAAAVRAGARRNRAILHQGLGALAFYRDRFEEASTHFAQAQGIFADIGESRGHAYANLGLGSVHLFHGGNEEAAALLGQAHASFERCSDASGGAFAAQALSILHRYEGRLEQAVQCLDHALATFRGLGSDYGQACALYSLGLHHEARGDREQAERALAEAIELFRAASCPRDEAQALHVLAATCAEGGDAERASTLMSRSLRVFSPEDESVGKASMLYSSGWVAHSNRRHDDASACFDQASRLFEQLGMPVQQARTMSARHQLGLSVPSE